MVVFSSTCFAVFVIMSVFTLDFINVLSEIVDKMLLWDCHKSCAVNLQDVAFVVFPTFLEFLLTFFSIGTEKVMHISFFSPKQVS